MTPRRTPCLSLTLMRTVTLQYQYASYGVEWQTVGRLTLDPHPYMSGRKSQLRIGASTMVAPGDVNGTGFLQVWAYDQHKLPGFYAFLPDTKRVRTYPVDQRFEPLFPGNTAFVTEYLHGGRSTAYLG